MFLAVTLNRHNKNNNNKKTLKKSTETFAEDRKFNKEDITKRMRTYRILSRKHNLLKSDFPNQ